MAKTKQTTQKSAVAAKTATVAENVTPEIQPAPAKPAGAAKAAPVEAANVKVDEEPEFVTVAFNHPHGVKFRVLDKYGVEHVLEVNGNATGLRGLEKGILPKGGAYGITPNVPAELWIAVKAKYQHMAIFRNGLIFATDDTRSAKKEAQNRESLRNGAEPVEPEHAGTAEE